jgi:septum formation protein
LVHYDVYIALRIPHLYNTFIRPSITRSDRFRFLLAVLTGDFMIVLASGSPRRRELMALLGVEVEIAKPDIDESQQPQEAPFDFVQRLSREKAEVVATQGNEGIVVAADTIVVAPRGAVLGKPRDEAEARAMLTELRGKTHKVFTGVTLINRATRKEISDVCESKVRLREMSDAEIEAYVASGDPMDKAAAYAIQNSEVAPVEQVIGCPANVMGLPMCHVVRSLRRHGEEIPASEPHNCQISYGGYYCAIADHVMPGVNKGVIP